MGVKIAPSIAAADQGRLAQEAAHLKEWGADWIHVDIMDGNFAPNLTFGPSIVKAIRKASDLPLDCHLMISNPETLLERFLEAGGDIMTIHAETVNPESLARIEKKIHEYKAKLGVAFKPVNKSGFSGSFRKPGFSYHHHDRQSRFFWAEIHARSIA